MLGFPYCRENEMPIAAFALDARHPSTLAYARSLLGSFGSIASMVAARKLYQRVDAAFFTLRAGNRRTTSFEGTLQR
jgi:hypothetical protein